MEPGYITLTMSRIEGKLIFDLVFKSWTAFSNDWRAGLTLLITLWVMFAGLQLMTATKGADFGKVLKSGAYAIIVWVLFTRWEYFVLFIYNTFMILPNELTVSLTKVVTNNSGATLYSGLDAIWRSSTEVSKQLMSEASWSNEGVGFLAMAGANLAATWIALCVAVGLIIFTDVMIGILLMIALVVLPFMIFEQTRGGAQQWARFLVGFAIVKLMLVAALAFMLGIIGSSIDELAAGKTEFSLEVVSANILLIVTSAVVFFLVFIVGAAMGNNVGMAAGVKINTFVTRSVTFNYGHWRK